MDTASFQTYTVQGNLFAIKSLKKEFKFNANYNHRFKREIELLDQLNGHENIIPLVHYGKKRDGRPFYVMPAADTNLYEYVRTNNSLLALTARIAIFDNVLKAIAYAHSIGVLHRDISPRNILLFNRADSNSLEVRVSDFGLGKNLKDDSGFTRSAATNYGQLYYVAPEQVEDLRNASVQSDLYSLAKLLDFTMTGKTPVATNSIEFRSVIDKATRTDPNERFSNVEDLAKAYERIKRLIAARDGDDFETLKKFTLTDGTVDWDRFQTFAAKGEYNSNIFKDYISPLIQVLSDDSNLTEYVAISDDSLEPVIMTLTKRFDELPATGWDFRALRTFAEILNGIFIMSRNRRVQLQCLRTLWKLGFEQDRWAAQQIVERILDQGLIPEEIQIEFAEIIMESNASVSPDAFSDSSVPKIIRQAILEKAIRT